MSKLALNSAHISTFPLPYPSRQTFSFSSALCHVFLPFPLLRYHFPLTLRPVLLSLTTRLSPLFFPYPLLCLLIFLPLSTCLLTLFFPMHFLSFPSLFHSPVPLFFSLSYIAFPPFSALPPTHSPLFPSTCLSSFLSSSYIVFSSFRTFHAFFFLFVPVFVSPFLFPFLVYPFPFIHTLSHLSPPSFSCTRLPHVFSFPPFSHSPPFLPRLPLPFPAKTILPEFSLRHKKTEDRSLPFFNRNNLLKKTISSVR